MNFYCFFLYISEKECTDSFTHLEVLFLISETFRIRNLHNLQCTDMIVADTLSLSLKSRLR